MMAPFSFNIQRDIVISCVAIYNYLRRLTIQGVVSDNLFDTYEDNNVDLEVSLEEDIVEPPHEIGDVEHESFMNQLREELADVLIFSRGSPPKCWECTGSKGHKAYPKMGFWEAIIRRTLKKYPQSKTNYKSYSAPPSPVTRTYKIGRDAVLYESIMGGLRV